MLEKTVGQIQKYEQFMKRMLKENYLFIIVNMLFGIIIYFLLISQNLVNDLDGVWHLSNFVAGKWEISLGRGLLRYVDKLYCGVIAMPFITAISLLIMIVTNIIAMNILDIKDDIFRYLFSFIQIASPIVCITLTHCYMSVGFAVAYLFAVLALIPVRFFSGKYRFVLCGLCIAISMSCYQAYLGVTCMLMTVFLLNEIIRGGKRFKILDYLRTCVLGGGTGGALYYLFVRFMVWYGDAELAGYRGANNISLKAILLNLPDSIKNCYSGFWAFCKYDMVSVPTRVTPLFLGLFFLLLLLMICFNIASIFRESKLYGIIFLAGIILIPIAGNASIILAPGNMPSGLMEMGMLYVVALFSVLSFGKDGSIRFLGKRFQILVLTVLLWLNIVAVENDQLSLYEGKTATVSLAQNILDEIMEQGYLTDYDYAVALVGRPANNPIFAWNPAYSSSNGYAKFGCWSVEAGNNRRSWSGVIYSFCGKNINLVDEETYREICQNKLVEEMPVFPEQGAVRVIGDVVVVKVSNVY